MNLNQMREIYVFVFRWLKKYVSILILIVSRTSDIYIRYVLHNPIVYHQDELPRYLTIKIFSFILLPIFVFCSTFKQTSQARKISVKY